MPHPFLMNKAANIVSESILGDFCKVVSFGSTSYPIYQPSIKVIARVIREWSKVGIDSQYTEVSVLSEVPQNAPFIAKGISYLIVGDVPFYELRAKRVYSKILKGSFVELKEAIEKGLNLMGGEDFFISASLVKNASKIVAKSK